MAAYTCVVNQVGPANYGSISNPNVYFNLTDTGGSFANTWCYAADGVQEQMLDVGIAAITGNKHVDITAAAPIAGDNTYPEIIRIVESRPLPPPAPANLQATVTSLKAGVSASSITVTWTENSYYNVQGFNLQYKGVAPAPPPAVSPDAGQLSLPAATTTVSFAATSGLTYTITLTAHNAVGTSAQVSVTLALKYVPPPTQTVTLSLQRQIPITGNVYYTSQYPPVGAATGYLEKISVPTGQVVAVNFLRPGHSTGECLNPSAVVTILQGTSTTQAQLTEMFGPFKTLYPVYSTANPTPFVACVLVSSAGQFPSFVNIQLLILPF